MTLKKMTPQGEIPMTKDEEVAFLADQTSLATTTQIAALRANALAALAESDIQVIRHAETGIALPEAWVAYRTALRENVRTGTGSLPDRPVYPS